MAAPALPNWQQQILARVGAPVTPQNLLFVNDWAKAEGGGASNNPFNTTQPAAGASSYNPVGVRNYGSPQQGINATVQTLNNGRYGGILGALRQGTSAKAAAAALAQSPWGTGSLVQRMLGQNPQAPAGPSPAGQGAAAPAASPPAGAQPTLGMPTIVASLLQNARQTAGLGASPIPLLMQQRPSSPVPENAAAPRMATSPAGTGDTRALASAASRLAAVPAALDTRPGIQVDAAILPTVTQLAQRFGVQVNSGYRSPQHNQSVGGAANSDHLRGDAVDFTGSPHALQALYRYAQGRFPYVEPMAQAKDHVHVSFRR